MKVVFRVDASRLIGNGHLIRCLALANSLSAKAADCTFLSSRLQGSVAEVVRGHGHALEYLEVPNGGVDPSQLVDEDRVQYARADASQVVSHLLELRPGLVVVDSYALDRTWEQVVRRSGVRIAVIDDLADRMHECDLLVDHNAGRFPKDYEALVPVASNRLIGPQFALLRPEFSKVRVSHTRLKNLGDLKVAVSMGGTDPGNATLSALEGLEASALPATTRVTLIMGHASAQIGALQARAAQSRLRCEIIVEPANFAELLAESDIALGGGGVSALERCCLGVPSLVAVLAKNQRPGANALMEAGAVLAVVERCDLRDAACALVVDSEASAAVAERARNLVDGLGTERVASKLLELARGC